MSQIKIQNAIEALNSIYMKINPSVGGHSDRFKLAKKAYIESKQEELTDINYLSSSQFLDNRIDIEHCERAIKAVKEYYSPCVYKPGGAVEEFKRAQRECFKHCKTDISNMELLEEESFFYKRNHLKTA